MSRVELVTMPRSIPSLSSSSLLRLSAIEDVPSEDVVVHLADLEFHGGIPGGAHC